MSSHSDRGFYRVAIRRHLAPVRPEAEALDGRCFHFTPGWEIEAESSSIYVGETAMMFAKVEELRKFRDFPAWIASGDLQPATDAEWGVSSVMDPAYQQEQREKNAKMRAALDNPAT